MLRVGDGGNGQPSVGVPKLPPKGLCWGDAQVEKRRLALERYLQARAYVCLRRPTMRWLWPPTQWPSVEESRGRRRCRATQGWSPRLKNSRETVRNAAPRGRARSASWRARGCATPRRVRFCVLRGFASGAVSFPYFKYLLVAARVVIPFSRRAADDVKNHSRRGVVCRAAASANSRSSRSSARSSSSTSSRRRRPAPPRSRSRVSRASRRALRFGFPVCPA